MPIDIFENLLIPLIKIENEDVLELFEFLEQTKKNNFSYFKNYKNYLKKNSPKGSELYMIKPCSQKQSIDDVENCQKRTIISNK